MILTLFCDASHCSRTLCAGWGAWAKREEWERGRIFGGPLTSKPTNSTEAELAAIANALQQLAGSGDLAGIKTLMIQSDSLAALAVVRSLPTAAWSRSDDRRDSSSAPAKKRLSASDTASLSIIREAAGRRPLFLRHIKGHKSGTGRNWVNGQCDRVAKRHMVQLRQAGEVTL
jgi:ribonuclease HI